MFLFSLKMFVVKKTTTCEQHNKSEKDPCNSVPSPTQSTLCVLLYFLKHCTCKNTQLPIHSSTVFLDRKLQVWSCGDRAGLPASRHPLQFKVMFLVTHGSVRAEFVFSTARRSWQLQDSQGGVSPSHLSRPPACFLHTRCVCMISAPTRLLL